MAGVDEKRLAVLYAIQKQNILWHKVYGIYMNSFKTFKQI